MADAWYNKGVALGTIDDIDSQANYLRELHEECARLRRIEYLLKKDALRIVERQEKLMAPASTVFAKSH